MPGILIAVAGGLILAADYNINERLKKFFKGKTDVPRKVDYAVNGIVGGTFVLSFITIVAGATLTIHSWVT